MGIFINLCPIPKNQTQTLQSKTETTTILNITELPDTSWETSTQITTIDKTEVTTSKITTSEIAEEMIISSNSPTEISLPSIPKYSGNPYVPVNGNQPYFTKSDLKASSFEKYSELDDLGRCGVAYACIGTDLMPTEKRGSIGSVKPSGWQTIKYDNIEGKYLYNRCHLIGYQLSGENANTRNLITGTRYLNIQGMLPFENMIADYVRETNNHTLYRVTPVFKGNNLIADGVLMEGYSVEDNGAGICFNVFAYNVQPGISIDYATGYSSLAQQSTQTTTQQSVTQIQTYSSVVSAPLTDTTTAYILNTNTKKFHYPTCSSVGNMAEKNKQEFSGTRDEAISQGYVPCKRCNP